MIEWLRSWGDISIYPKTIFVRTDLIQYFYDKILPCLSTRFVLIIGDSDMSFPRQIDDRYPNLFREGNTFLSLLNDSRIVHIFSEHLDERHDGHLSPIPLGVNPMEFPRMFGTLRKQHDGDYLLPYWIRNISFNNKLYQNHILRIDRLREDGRKIWLDRRKVASYCNNEWHDFCISSGEIRKGLEFHKYLSKFTFVLCVHGGGIDPNPKLWQTLMAGSIPIMAHFPGDIMYDDFPIAFIDTHEWNNQSVTKKKLINWLFELRSYYEDPIQREIVLEKLTSQYWWNKIEDKIQLI
jgi:hypothetical protein